MSGDEPGQQCHQQTQPLRHAHPWCSVCTVQDDTMGTPLSMKRVSLGRGREMVHGGVIHGGTSRVAHPGWHGCSPWWRGRHGGFEGVSGAGLMTGRRSTERGCSPWFALWDRGMSVLANESACRGNALPVRAPLKQGWSDSAAGGPSMLCLVPQCWGLQDGYGQGSWHCWGWMRRFRAVSAIPM